jgi:bacterioferritin
MKSHSELVSGIQDVNQDFNTSIIQMQVHKSLVEHWGYTKLHQLLASSHSRRVELQNRLLSVTLLFECIPDLQLLKRLKIGQTVEEIFQSERRISEDVLTTCQNFSSLHGGLPIYLEVVLNSLCNEIYSYKFMCEKNLELIRQMGTPNFLATQC